MNEPDTDGHPFFLKAPPARRWTGSYLSALYLELEKESRENLPEEKDIAADKGWSWRVLRRGLVVALRRRPDLWNRREIRIARLDAPKDAPGWKAWETEVGNFLEQVTIRPLDGETPCRHVHRDWYRVPLREREQDTGKAAVRFLELREAEVAPGRAICWGCYQLNGEVNEIEWFHGAGEKGQLCQPCLTLKRQGQLPEKAREE